MELVNGARLGPYEIVGPLGHGGMGDVYRAVDTRLERTVAIKVLSAGVADSPERRQRFEREARAISSLNHPHICALYDVGEPAPSTGSGQAAAYLVMEYLEGETLAHRLVRGALPIDDVLRYAVQIADALDHAHRQGIVHRDLKPANIMLTRAGVKLLDFGVAALRNDERMPGDLPGGRRPVETITEEGAIVGTLEYMAPEQLEGRDADARSDLFALGAVIFEMATGRRAFDGPSRASVIASILERDVTPPSVVRREVPPLLDQIVTRCLSKHANDRWQSAADLKQAITWITHGTPTDRVPVVSSRRNARRAIGAVGVFVLASLAIAVAIVASRRAASDRPSFRFTMAPSENANFSQSSLFMALSPDGRTLAFIAASQDGNNKLWVRSLDSLTARPLAGTDEASQPFWSTDSRFVTFGVARHDTLKTIDVASGSVQTIAGTRATYGSWNDDGVLLLPTGPQQGGVLRKFSAGGGSPIPVTSLDTTHGETNHSGPQFLPDGRHFIFLARQADPNEDSIAYVGSLDSMDRVRLLTTDSQVAYDPQGYLVFMHENTLFAQPFDHVSLRLTGEPVKIAERVERTSGSHRGAFTISRTGVLAYRSIAETRLAWYDRDGKQLQTIGPPGQYSNPALSPDEQRLAVGRLDFDTGTPDIWMLDLQRDGVAARFTSDDAPEEMPLWSPDGNRLVFKFRTAFHQQESSGGSTAGLLLDNVGAYGTPLGWSHDGRTLLYQIGNQKADVDLWTLGLAGNTPTPWLRTEFHEGQAQLSPDNQWIAYASNESGRNEVYLRMFPSGEGKRQISTHGGLEPRWRGDGKELFYLALDRRLMSVSVNGGSTFDAGHQPTSLFETRMSVAFDPSYTRNQYVVSKDAQRFLINQPAAGGSPSPITIVVNWHSALKR